MKLRSLDELFVHELKDLYSAETQIVEALPKMIEAASSTELKKAFEQHLKETRSHVSRIEKILKGFDEEPGQVQCKGMAGLLQEGEEILKENIDPDVKDAALITAAQRVEHYEMAGYGAVRNYALRLDYVDAADLLQQTLDEEGEANKKLTNLAESGINRKADK
jgi:ferritin-like metal-binding protein YciE